MATIQDIQFLLDNWNDISNLFMASNKWDKWSNAIKSQLNLLNKWMWEYRNERSPIEKTKKLNVMLGQYNTINNLIKSQKNIINSQIKELSKTADDFWDDLLKDEVNNYNEIYKKIYNRQDNKQTNNITDIIPWDTETPKQEEVKQDTTPVVDTTKQVTETPTTTTVPVDTKPTKYQWRKLVYDDKWNLIWFVSKKTWETVKLWDKLIWDTVLTKDNLNNEINKWIAWYKWETIKMLEKEKQKTDDKDKIKKFDSWISDIKKELIKRWITENQMKEMWIQ